jgi:hypothetical protein
MKSEIIIIGIMLVFLSGCASSNVYPGTFKLGDPPTKTLELREDGTYLLIPVDVKYTEKGIYVKRENQIECTDAFGFTEIMTITDKGLIGRDGKLWVKVPNN